MLCLCAAQLKFWLQTDLGRENSSSCLQAGKSIAFDFSLRGHALVTLYVQFLCSDWSKFDRWVHAENLCSILNLVYFDSWSWQSFVSTYVVFNCLFPLDVQSEIQLLSRVFCYSWQVCLLGFWLRNTSLVKVGNLRSPVSAIQILRSIFSVSTFFSPLSFFPDFFLDFFPDFFLDFFLDFFPDFFPDFFLDFFPDYFLDFFLDFFPDFFFHHWSHTHASMVHFGTWGIGTTTHSTLSG